MKTITQTQANMKANNFISFVCSLLIAMGLFTANVSGQTFCNTATSAGTIASYTTSFQATPSALCIIGLLR